MSTRYKVYTSTDRATKKLEKYVVIDAEEISDAKDRPRVAEFPVSILHDEKTQGIRAEKFAEYLNSLVDIMNDLEKDQKI